MRFFSEKFEMLGSTKKGNWEGVWEFIFKMLGVLLKRGEDLTLEWKLMRVHSLFDKILKINFKG